MNTELLKELEVNESNVVTMNRQYDRSDYELINKAIKGIGGKWDRKSNGFIFQHDPTPLLRKIQNGEIINLKKDFQFFHTPKVVADVMVFFSTYNDNIKSILEPSAGQGHLVEAIIEKYDCTIDCIELMPQNRSILKSKGFNLIHDDFMTFELSNKYDLIFANPPFTKNQCFDHVYKMYEHLNPGGELISVMPMGWQDDNTIGAKAKFREFLYDNDGSELQRFTKH